MEVATGREGTLLRGHAGWVLALAFTPDGLALASGGLIRPSACGTWLPGERRPHTAGTAPPLLCHWPIRRMARWWRQVIPTEQLC